MQKNKFIPLSIIVFLFLLGVAQADEELFEKEFEVKNGGSLYLDSDAGSVEIGTHTKPIVELKVSIKGGDADDFKISSEQSGKDVSVKGDRKSIGWGSNSLRVNFIVTVPKEYDLRLETGGGSISVQDLIGEIDAKTSGGSIIISDVRGDVDVKTSGGSIRVEDVAGNIKGRTSGGSIKVKFSEQITQDSVLSTSGGSIAAYLPTEIKVDIDASTSGGRVRSDFNVDGTVKKTKIKGEINDGGPLLKLRTSGGNVSIKEH
ncbi:MAG: DUF4097 domain-containing protein [Gammaproteobacteria bacterium]|nr:DUF4097 domain-containing protein [Gammaproteobacteria bacterium]